MTVNNQIDWKNQKIQIWMKNLTLNNQIFDKFRQISTCKPDILTENSLFWTTKSFLPTNWPILTFWKKKNWRILTFKPKFGPKTPPQKKTKFQRKNRPFWQLKNKNDNEPFTNQLRKTCAYPCNQIDESSYLLMHLQSGPINFH